MAENTSTGKNRPQKAKPKADTGAKERREIIKLLKSINKNLEYLCNERRRNTGG